VQFGYFDNRPNTFAQEDSVHVAGVKQYLGKLAFLDRI
jgi:hypothetical protein